jgi:molecular chaperone GrpE (heat shock protein)
MNNEQMQAAMKELQDAMVVMAHMETRQTERLLREEREVEELAISRARVEQRVLRLDEESAQFRRRTEQNLAEITDKLNGLIGYVAGGGRPQ